MEVEWSSVCLFFEKPAILIFKLQMRILDGISSGFPLNFQQLVENYLKIYIQNCCLWLNSRLAQSFQQLKNRGKSFYTLTSENSFYFARYSSTAFTKSCDKDKPISSAIFL